MFRCRCGLVLLWVGRKLSAGGGILIEDTIERGWIVLRRVLEEVSSVIRDGLPFTAAEAARQQVILAAEFAAGWFEPPPEEWQLAGVQGGPPGDPGPADGGLSDGVPGGGSWAGEPPWLPGESLSPAEAAQPGARFPDGGPSPAVAPGAGQAQPASSGGASSGGAVGAVSGVAEAVPCGIVAHDADGPGGAGFASGSVLDTLAPGPVLCGALDDVHDAGLAGLGDDELAGVILAARRCESRALAGLLGAVAELHRRRMGHPDRRVGEHAAGELAILMTLTGRAAIGLMDQAAALRRLPATMAALRAGRIDRARAAVIAYETELLDDDDVAAAVELLVIEDGPGLGPARLGRRP